MKGDRNMGVYLGYIKIVSRPSENLFQDNLYYNFKPIAEVKNSQIIELSDDDREKLLPYSKNRDIHLSFQSKDIDTREKMKSMFTDKSLAIFEFEIEDLSPSINVNTNERNDTGYRVIAKDFIGAEKIRKIDSEGIYHVIHENELKSDFIYDSSVEIKIKKEISANNVFVKQEIYNCWAGPYEIRENENALYDTYYIKPDIRQNKYTIKGYELGDCEVKKLRHIEKDRKNNQEDEYQWEILVPKKEAERKQFDVISDEILLDSFCNSIENSKTVNGKISINVDDIPLYLNNYENSILSGSELDSEIISKRLKRLTNILTSDEAVDDTFVKIADSIGSLIVKYQDRPEVVELINTLIEKKPQLFEELKGTRPLIERRESLEQDVKELYEEKSSLEQEIKEKESEKEQIDKDIETLEKELLRDVNKEYDEKCLRLEEKKEELKNIAELLNLAIDINAFNKRIIFLEQREEDLKDKLKQRENAQKEIASKFDEIIKKKKEDMVNFAFDGFMSSKLLTAAAEWESECLDQEYNKLIEAVNNVEAVEKSPEELIDYLCKTIQVVRPSYTRNTILNIAICLTQGFLTVFSGEPGCGKTSICNIFGQVLGLNKISESDSANRYVSVSVEKGWTSKRDLIGYYNPLSKTFDRSNRRVYDALYQLNTEKDKGICKFPYLILLDEANLSPMEYYWSDFMNICDDHCHQEKINLGEDHIFKIPETLHFVATINNDDTTERLSPRLIDRAWIVTLPEETDFCKIYSDEIPEDKIEIISWNSLSNAFGFKEQDCKMISKFPNNTYMSIIKKMREMKISVSPRTDKAIKAYWAIAAKYFEKNKREALPEYVALDYAIAQKILPKIKGYDEKGFGENNEKKSFKELLSELLKICSDEDLEETTKILTDIINRGTSMNYYQFFS